MDSQYIVNQQVCHRRQPRIPECFAGQRIHLAGFLRSQHLQTIADNSFVLRQSIADGQLSQNGRRSLCSGGRQFQRNRRHVCRQRRLAIPVALFTQRAQFTSQVRQMLPAALVKQRQSPAVLLLIGSLRGHSHQTAAEPGRQQQPHQTAGMGKHKGRPMCVENVGIGASRLHTGYVWRSTR